jgi:Baseplate J-like protein
VIYACCDRGRLKAVREDPSSNGIEFLEVLDREAPAGSPRQQTLLVNCFRPIPAMNRDHVRITGGERVRTIGVPWAFRADLIPATLLTPAEQTFMAGLTKPTQVFVVRTDSTGDHSNYHLDLQQSPTDPAPPGNFDPLYSGIDFSFKVECDSEFDCKVDTTCPEPYEPGPDVDYLAKDYGSFRRLMLDRITQLVPGWRERSAADVGVTLTELLAYVGDHLSYQQDAVATEAYLDTARHRTSLRRHALLVDYRLHDGSNARAWAHIEVNANVTVVKSGVQFLTRVTGLPDRIVPDSTSHEDALAAGADVFELLLEKDTAAIDLFVAHNRLPFYTWGDDRCCLPEGAQRATLDGHFPNLKNGQVLIFEEVMGPSTGAAGDANPSHRHAVRLERVVHSKGGAPLEDPLNNQQITQIEWGPEDALPFPLCISSITDDAHGSTPLKNVSVAGGNVVLVDHGRTIGAESLGSVPVARIPVATGACDPCASRDRQHVLPRYSPRLLRQPLTLQGTVQKPTLVGGKPTKIRVPLDESASAAAAMRWDPRDIVPSVTLTGTKDTNVDTWLPKPDLLNSGSTAREFVAEIEDDGGARIRFGRMPHGLRPESDTRFTATYRVGNGVAGNVGAEAIHHVVSTDGRLVSVRNPLPARGGTDPETKAQVRRRAPQAFRTQQRAVTPEDYAHVTQLHESVQRAAATLRWTGSWYTVFVTVDRVGGTPLDDDFREDLRRHVDRYRMAGHDLEFDDPRFVSLELDMHVCVEPDYFREQVKQALRRVFSRRALPDGRLGIFHPDNFSFGQPVYLSPLYAAARAVPGVQSVRIDKFQRQGIEDTQYLDAGRLSLGRLEIARLDNDPNFPDRGVLRLNMGGGK